MLQLLLKLFGKGYINKIIGTRANVTKPIKFDTNSPYKLYSDEAFRDPKSRALIESKLEEYGPLVLSNKNASEISNFEMNARRLIEAKNKEFGITDRLKETRTQKPEADVLDIKTGKKAEGIESLKEDLGLPPEVSPKSEMGQALLQSKRTFKAMDDEVDDSGTLVEGRRRPIIRQILSEEDTIQRNLSETDYDDLLFGKDLDKGADPNKDPFKYLDEYFVRDDDQLDILDDIIDEMPGSTPAEISAEFRKRTGGLKPKDPDLGDKLKDVPDDIPDMANGGVLSPQMQDFLENYSDQMTFEQYLQMMAMRAKKANGGLSYLLRV